MNTPLPVTSPHLYQPVRYRARDGSWHAMFNEAVLHSGHQLTWDYAAILSMISFGYICGDRTLVKEIKRQPWLSEIRSDGEPILQPIPAHHRIWRNAKEVAKTLERLLYEEAILACQGRKEIYVLLSGGLDSRVVAGIASQLFREGKLSVKPVCVTWGLPDSRDVVYGKRVAEILGLEWIYISLEPGDLLHNVEVCAKKLGAMISPAHLQRMEWFQNVDQDAIVLSGSYGDMVGRAEFSGLQLLELNYLKPTNGYSLLNSQVLREASQILVYDLQALHDRSPQQPRYVVCEHEMHAHYTRSMLAQAMSLINHYCTVYQMFTHPNVYGYMWSLHPAVRTDAIYAALLERLGPKLARLPWARTNRALRGKTEGKNSELIRYFNDYIGWITGPLYEDLLQIIESSKLLETGLFQIGQVKELCEAVKRRSIDPRYYDGYDIFVWLACMTRFIEWCDQMEFHITIEYPEHAFTLSKAISIPPVGKLRAGLRNISPIYRSVKFARRLYFRFSSIFKYPPEFQ
jgi:asparagine synthase (glutamine-hydrolysing)